MLSNDAAVRRFAVGKTGHSGNIYSEGYGLYSYGHHWALALRVKGKRILLNGDRYHRPTTNHHASITFSVFPDDARVSFSALQAAGILTARPIGEQTQVEIVDHTPDLYIKVYNPDLPKPEWETEVEDTSYTFHDFHPPIGCTIGQESTDKGQVTYKWAHRLGAVVIRYDGADYLSAMDEGSYFLAKLPHRVRTVEGAYRALQPDSVRKAYKSGLQVERQGEWFFIPQDDAKVGHLRPYLYGPRDLPRRDERSNIHRAPKGFFQFEGMMFVQGMIRHLSPSGQSARVSWGRRFPQLHRPLRLAKGVIYRAVESLALQSWSGGGRVD